MPQPASSNPNVVPPWIVYVGSAVIAAHFVTVAALVLAAPSGPWWVPPFGQSDAVPPKFAQLVNDVSAPHYLRHLKLIHNYHFASNRMASPGVKFEAVLKDK